MSDSTDNAAGMVAYKNRNTGDVFVFDGPNAELEARANFEQCDAGDVPQHVLDAHKRARAERSMIEAAAADRADVTEARAAAAVAAANQESTDPAGVIAVTGSHEGWQGPNDGTGVLSREGVNDVQIGPDPDEHPKTYAELLAKAEEDSQNPALGGPGGVLDRDQGDTEAPTTKPRKTAAKKATAKADKPES